MYTIISGTNRPNSHTEKVAIEYHKILKGKNIEAFLLSLKNIKVLKKNPAKRQILQDFLIYFYFVQRTGL